MVTHHNRSAAAAGSVSVGQDHQRGWSNVQPQRQEQVTVVISDRVEKGAHNVPPDPQTQDDS